MILKKKNQQMTKNYPVGKELNWLRCQSDCGYQSVTSVSMGKLGCILKVNIQCKTKDGLSHNLANTIVSPFQPQVNII